MICDDLACEGSDTFDFSGEPLNGQVTLARLSLTCRSLSIAALRALWRTVRDMGHFVKYTMPADFWLSGEVFGRSLTPSRLPSEEDLKRFKFYAAFIREMQFAGTVTLHDDIYNTLCMACNAPVFPNLTRISWDSSGLNLIYIHYFLCPSITSLHITANSVSMGDISILNNVQRRWSSTIIDLKIEHPAITHGTITAFMDTICSWRLQRLSLSRIDWSRFADIASSAALRILQLGLHGDFDLEIPSTIEFSASCTFESLTTLRIGTRMSFQTCIGMWRASSFACLAHLTINGLDTEPACWGELFAAIRAAHTNPRLLRTLLISDHLEDDDTPGSGLKDVEEPRFAPLYDFCELDDVFLSSRDGFGLTMTTIEGMARAWPRLEELSLMAVSFLENPQLPLNALAHLAANCPRLSRLEIDVDATNMSLKDAPQAPWSPQSALMALNVNWSSIGSARPVAAYLLILFPNLRNVYPMRPASLARDADVRVKRWDRVQYLLPVLAAVRDFAIDRDSAVVRWKEFNNDGYGGALDV
ncbi:hypothetical protein BD626DRAFT_564338 [Schizophyllum amplum]|uniref:F-box domain-containing protein n=1 Tax=Schizophyllum amplum TaxID=97359 RepID=A0A550CRG9_9AGAR|nr:hypothetical protein BD626DRAFT_564338 [Auriculariopsis ampla]